MLIHTCTVIVYLNEGALFHWIASKGGQQASITYCNMYTECKMHNNEHYTKGTEVWKRLEGQDVAASVDKTFFVKSTATSFFHTLPSNHCAISDRRSNIIDLLKLRFTTSYLVCFVKKVDILLCN